MPGAPGELTLHVERVLPASRHLVFGMFTEPERLARFWGPKGFTAASVALDARVGGEYRIEMQPPEGERFFLGGEFRRVERPSHLTYTFRYEDPDPDDRETVVALSLDEQRDATLLTLDQAPFLTDARLALHAQGWAETLDRLEALVSSEGAE